MTDISMTETTAVLEAVQTLLARSKDLAKAVQFDDSGMLVGQLLVGGNGGLISRSTSHAALALSIQIETVERLLK